ncbi:MAG: ribosome maturation factor RimM [Candidatus Latescibacterota bacterium]
MREKRPRRFLLRPEKAHNAPGIPVPWDSIELVSVGKAVQVHGLQGYLKVVPFTDTLERFESLRSVYLESRDGAQTCREVESVKIQNGIVLLKFSGIDDRTAAEALQGVWISVRRDEAPELPEDSYYIFDLVGTEVFNESGSKIGTVARVEEYPANAVLIVESESEEVWIPALKEVVTAVDLNAKRLTVRLPEGLPTYPKGGI